MARHRAGPTHNRPTGQGQRCPVRSGPDALPLWAGLLLTAADTVNRPWFSVGAVLVVSIRAALGIRLFRLPDRRYRDQQRPSGTAPGGPDGGGERDDEPATGA
jgi:hypothetical protein